MAVAGGVAVANVYYVQPILELMATDLHVSARSMGTIAMMMQVGYALGILIFVPLGDIVQRRSLIVGMFAVVSAVLFGVAAAPTFGVLALAILLVGITTTAPQVLLPLAADLAAPDERGRVLGTVQTGLIVGTLAARAIGGIIGAHFGWRAVFEFAGCVSAVATVVLARILPLRPPTVAMRYVDVLRSLPGFVARFPALRISMGLGFISFSTFAGVWTVLAFHARELGYGADIVGYIGLVSVIGAIFAARAGALADRRGTLVIGTIAWLLTLAAFAAYGLAGGTIWGVLGASALLALGTQWTQIANQTRIFALDGSARSRINTIYMFNNFAGGAAGSLLAAWTYDAGGWPAFCTTSFVEVAAMALFLLWYRASLGARPGVKFAPGARSS